MRVCPKCHSIYSDEGVSRCGIDGEVVIETAEDPFLGRTIDRYRITKQLGQGGMGLVYRAQNAIGKMVAFKILFGDIASNEKLRKRFAREAELSAQLNHRNIIHVYDSGATGEGVPYLLMELLEGRTLEALLREEGALAPPRAAILARQIAAGLGYAHAKNVIHRDLKTANIFVVIEDAVEVPKVLDFGLARVHDPSLDPGESPTRLTKTGHTMGTPHYMAPEQLRGEEVTARADLYALGVILYEMLAGKPPFNGTIDRVLYQHAVEPPPPLPPHDGLTAVALRLLEKHPEDRYASTDEVIVALDALDLYGLRGPTPAIGISLRSQPTVVARPPVAPANRIPLPRPRRGMSQWIAVAIGSFAVFSALILWTSGAFDRDTVVVLEPAVGPPAEAERTPEPSPVRTPPPAVAPAEPPRATPPPPPRTEPPRAPKKSIDHPAPVRLADAAATPPPPVTIAAPVPVPPPVTPATPPIAERQKQADGSARADLTNDDLTQRLRKILARIAAATSLDQKVKAGIEHAYFDLDRDIRSATTQTERLALLRRITALESTVTRETKRP